MDSDISKIIELIDKKIKALSITKQTLIDEFGNGKPEVSRPFPRATLADIDVHQLSRKDAVAKLIREQGPQSRREIIEKTGFPEGTVAYVLNDKNRFVSTQDDKWDIVENMQGN